MIGKAARNLALCIGPVALALAPVSASANTRAGASGAFYSTGISAQIVADDVDRSGAWIIGDQGLLAIVFGVLLTGGIIWAIDDDTDQSPGT